MNILVIGQSHIAAIRDAARARREADPERPRTRVIHTLEPQYTPEIESGAFAPALEDTIRDQISRHAPLVASAMGGNFHNTLTLIRHPRAFDFMLTDEGGPPLADDAEPIALGLVQATLEAGLERDFTRLRLLRAIAGPFVHLESPPPVRDDGWIAAHADRYFGERGLASHGVAPAGLRWRIWRLNARLFRARVEALGGRVLAVPAAVQDADGFLRPEYAGDATHGNAAYGETMLQALEQFGASA